MRSRLLAGALAGGLLLVVAGSGPVAAEPVAPAPTPAPAVRAGDAPPTIELVSQPIVVAPTDPFTVILDVDGAPAGSRLVVDIYDRITDPGQVGIDPEDSKATFDPIDLPDRRTQRTGFKIDLYGTDDPRPPGPWAWQIEEAGVYPVRVKLWDAEDTTLTTFVTNLVRTPGPDEPAVTPAEVAVMPRIHQDPADVGGSPLSTGYLRRLDRILSVLRSHPTLGATFSVTPETLERFVTDDGAADALGRLRTEARRDGREVLDAPYVDIDPASLVEAELADEIARQRDLGRQTLTDLLAAPTAGTWDLRHTVDQASLTALRSRGIFRALLPDDAFGTQPDLRTFGVRAGDGDVRAVPVTSSYALDGNGPEDPVLGAHLLLARLAASTGAGRAPKIVVPIDIQGVDPLALPIVFDALSFGNPFFRAGTVSNLFGTSTAADVTATVAPVADRDLGRYPDLSREAHASLASYAAMVASRPSLARRYDRPLAVAASSDLKLLDRESRLVLVQRTLQRRFHLITTPERDKVTLGSRDGKFPLTITSDLGYRVQVLIEVESNDRLEFPDDHIVETLDPGRTIPEIRVHARASGDTPVRITVRSPDGRQVLAESQYRIRSTAVSGVGTVLTIGAAAFLALWWGRHWYRARQKPKHAKGSHPPAVEM